MSGGNSPAAYRRAISWYRALSIRGDASPERAGAGEGLVHKLRDLARRRAGELDRPVAAELSLHQIERVARGARIHQPVAEVLGETQAHVGESERAVGIGQHHDHHERSLAVGVGRVGFDARAVLRRARTARPCCLKPQERGLKRRAELLGRAGAKLLQQRQPSLVSLFDQRKKHWFPQSVIGRNFGVGEAITVEVRGAHPELAPHHREVLQPRRA